MRECWAARSKTSRLKTAVAPWTANARPPLYTGAASARKTDSSHFPAPADGHPVESGPLHAQPVWNHLKRFWWPWWCSLHGFGETPGHQNTGMQLGGGVVVHLVHRVVG